MIAESQEWSELRIEALVQALTETFGNRALEVARRQVDAADPGNAVVWQAIVNRLAG